ncbi:hypothetical protein ACA29_02750 [Lederbergia galactosidilytica]|uniref:Uncharacterized protein n=1 Tax=Lederbergia galactosidilytica TaxID=217031 RepID=A0A0Q9YKM9_9BACI|nr:hypothetical protein ACA29_02750 [Lederbergia galactosidilytica]
MELLSSYKANIWEMTQQLKELRRNNRKISSVLKGYILVETYSNHSSFPANLMHAIHMVPKVVGLPSNNNVPQEEIDFFFQQIDMTPEVEIEIDEIVNVAEAEMTKRELLARANDVIGTNEEKEIFDQMDSINFSFEAELDTLIADYETSHQKKRIDASVRQKINEIKLSMQRKKNRVTMPAALFQSVILNTQNSLSSNMVVSPDCKTLIEGLRKTLESEEGKGVAHGL